MSPSDLFIAPPLPTKAAPLGSSPPLSTRLQTGSTGKPRTEGSRGAEQATSFARESPTKKLHKYRLRRNTTSGEQPPVSSKAASSGRTRRQNAAAARSEDFGFSSGAKKGRKRLLRCLQEGDDVQERRRRIPRKPRERVSPRQTLFAFYTRHRTSTGDTQATVTASRLPAHTPPSWPWTPANT